MSAARKAPAVLAHENSSIDIAEAVLAATGLELVERAEIRTRKEIVRAIPEAYRSGKTGARLRSLLPPSRKLWSHQALALEKLEEGKNVLVTTGTGSGKSLIFQLPALREILKGGKNTLVLYPQKALGSDQLRRWQSALEKIGCDPNLVGEIHGDVPTSVREPIVDRARILLATPDTVHSWLLRYANVPTIERFLKNLSLAVVDEAHAYHGVMGSNSAFLFRRLRTACKWANADPQHEISFILASATLDNPEEFAATLVGVPFAHISEELDGSPAHGLTVLHVDGPGHGPAGEAALAEVLSNVRHVLGGDAFLAFADARQGIERISRKLEDDSILPYRSGYEACDRKAIETALHAKQLNGCVATSALEMGIDVASFRAGFNLGVPRTRMALRQRAGRIGRGARGVFVIIAPANAFAKLGTSLDEYLFGDVEISHLYLENPLIQYQQARCLLEELGGPDKIDVALEALNWPGGFKEALELASPGAELPREIARVAQRCGPSPHLSFPLRRIADQRMDLRHARTGEIIGCINVEQALREAAPGCTYFHNRKSYYVAEWKTSSFERSIIVEPIKRGAPTKAIAYTQCGYALDPDQVIDRRHLAGRGGLIAETHLRVTQSAIGYSIAGKPRYYSDLVKGDKRLRRQMRVFETTGVVMRLDAPVFAGPSQAKAELRKKIGEAIRSILATSHGVEISEIGLATSGISQFSGGSPIKDENAIALYDDIEGGLRLTEIIYSDFPEILDRLDFAAELAGSQSMLDVATIENLVDWYDGLTFVTPDQSPTSSKPTAIYAPGSIVGAWQNGQLCERELLGHDHLDMGGQAKLMYRYDAGKGISAWVAADAIHPVGDNWRLLTSAEMQGGVQ